MKEGLENQIVVTQEPFCNWEFGGPKDNPERYITIIFEQKALGDGFSRLVMTGRATRFSQENLERLQPGPSTLFVFSRVRKIVRITGIVPTKDSNRKLATIFQNPNVEW